MVDSQLIQKRDRIATNSGITNAIIFQCSILTIVKSAPKIKEKYNFVWCGNKRVKKIRLKCPLKETFTAEKREFILLLIAHTIENNKQKQ